MQATTRIRKAIVTNTSTYFLSADLCEIPQSISWSKCTSVIFLINGLKVKSQFRRAMISLALFSRSAWISGIVDSSLTTISDCDHHPLSPSPMAVFNLFSRSGTKGLSDRMLQMYLGLRWVLEGKS